MSANHASHLFDYVIHTLDMLEDIKEVLHPRRIEWIIGLRSTLRIYMN